MARKDEPQEINLIDLANAILSRKWLIVKLASVFSVLGIVIGFTSPAEYKTSSILIQEISEGKSGLSGSIGGLASLAGVDLNGLGTESQGVNPILYESVSKSTPFLLELMYQEFSFKEINSEISLYDYYYSYYKTSLFQKALSIPRKLISLVKGTSSNINSSLGKDSVLLKLTEYEDSYIEDLKKRVNVEVDWELNVMVIEVEMQDPYVAAQMVQFTQKYLTEYVTEYAISKNTQEFTSVSKQYLDRKKEFEQAQYVLANFRDRNQNVTTSRARSEEERLQSEYDLAFNIYNQLAQQREAIRLQIQENTPVFTVLEPVQVPLYKSSPRRFLTLIAFGFLGFVVGIGIVVFKFFT